MRPSSAKAKGRRLQNAIKDMILAAFPSLEPDDVKPAIMGEAGRDIHLSPAAKRLLPVAFEAKNQERLNIWEALKQARSHAKEGEVPLLVFTRNREEVYVALPFKDYLHQIGGE